MADSTPRRGLDGLTPDELAASRRAWWDDAFTELLLRRVPVGTRQLTDVGCGLATAAHALLPKLPATTYVGVDADAERLEEARKLLAGVPYLDRVELRIGRAEHLPVQDGEAEVVLVSMTMQHLPDPRAALGDIGRALAPGGTLIAVEPDQTASQVYFDGVLDDVTAAFRELFGALRRRRLPADVAIGPALATLAEREGLHVQEFFPYVVGKARKTTARAFFSTMTELVRIVSASLAPEAPEPQACRAALAASEASVGPSTTGYGCHLVPVFVCVARKG